MGDHIQMRLSGGSRVATIEVLASDNGPVEMPDDEDILTAIEQATCGAVHAALRGWTERARD